MGVVSVTYHMKTNSLTCFSVVWTNLAGKIDHLCEIYHHMKMKLTICEINQNMRLKLTSCVKYVPTYEAEIDHLCKIN